MSITLQMSSLSCGCISLLVAGLLAGCAGGGAGPGGLGLVGSCKDVRRELKKYEARGVHMQADAVARGAKLSSKQRAQVARYNGLLNTYLGNKCHL